jgi:outer membrane protein TolC
MRESRDRYEAGMESLADYLEAQTIHSQAGLLHVEACIAMRLCETYLKKATGEL